jgi:hypothetical protein
LKKVVRSINLANLTRKRSEKTKINKIKDERGDITTNTNEIQGIIREYLETCIYIQVNWKIRGNE